MKCPKCGRELLKKGVFVTNNAKKGEKYKEYRKATFWCADDDIWISVETPIVPTKYLA